MTIGNRPYNVLSKKSCGNIQYYWQSHRYTVSAFKRIKSMGASMDLGLRKMLDDSSGIYTLVKPLRHRAIWLLAGLASLAIAVACSSSGSGTSSPTETPLPAGPDVSVIVVTTDYGVGSNRVVFGLVARDGTPVRTSEVQVRALLLPSGQAAGEVRDTATAKFRQWPVGEQGVFTTTLEFNTAGIWEIEADTTNSAGKAVTARGAIQVQPESATPSIGHPAPASITHTVDEVDDLANITSSPLPDPDLYRLSVHEALDAGKPLVVVFATPAFCITATCGPQVEVISQLKERFSERANFIHVEVYEKPHLINEVGPTEGMVKAVSEWNLPTEPWTFIVDQDGLVRAKFEAFTTLEELEMVLEGVLGS